jgi:murein DD-endopeptidase MepM/ murein hydrolase activator NlpD
MRPVDEKYRITQGFASLPTRGVIGNLRGSQVQVLVALYGHYQEDGHVGTDIGCPVGTPVRAARSGTVIWCDWDVNLPGGPDDWAARWFFYQRFGGRLLLVQHAPGDIDVYAHLSAFKVRKGQFVNEGDLIALSGDS